ncbi:MAG: undecaprenyl-diphosphatase UppP [Acidobacteria bacterium]|nr:undecaprenyl-diphosphatase UppP [Acidobacteriota bacterium]MBV9070827.1 undecaprenyl-diphosphatase UppP [Acidobacteriota bacterium]MBV9186476.1 undecaprenyl-diphosphatase UppP [Acidobacteriota bacterium]
MTITEAIVLGLVQGLTEFIPVSSTAHLLIVPSILGWGDPGAAVSAVIQFGTLLAAIIYFFRDIVRLIAGFFRGLITRRPLADVDSREAWLVVIGTIPIVVLGLLFKKHIESTFRGLWIVTTMVIVVAILMQIAEWYAKRKQLRQFDDMTVADGVAIGLGQCLALIPGSSRSGSTIMTAIFRGIDRPTAARYSFLLSIPAVGGAGVLELFKERHALGALGWTPIAVAIIVAFISGYASIWFLIRYLRSHTTHVFIYYRYVLGIAMIAMLMTGYLKG